MVSLLIYDLYAKSIYLLYFMLLGSNYASFFVFQSLINNAHFPHADQVQKKFYPFSIVMNVAYSLAVLAAFLPRIGVYCSPDD